MIARYADVVICLMLFSAMDCQVLGAAQFGTPLVISGEPPARDLRTVTPIQDALYAFAEELDVAGASRFGEKRHAAEACLVVEPTYREGLSSKAAEASQPEKSPVHYPRVIEKAIFAIGGAERIAKAGAFSWTAKCKAVFDGKPAEFENSTIVSGFDQLRTVIKGRWDRRELNSVTVLVANKGWSREEEKTIEMGACRVASEKRSLCLQIIPITVLPLKDKGFKYGAAKAASVSGKAATGFTVIEPNGVDSFTLYFDNETSLPVRLVATVVGLDDELIDEEVTYSDYREFDGIKKATKIITRFGDKQLVEEEIVAFKILDKVSPGTFAEPRQN